MPLAVIGFLLLLTLWTVAFGSVWVMALYMVMGGIPDPAAPSSDLPFFSIVIGGFAVYGYVAVVIIRSGKRACSRKS